MVEETKDSLTEKAHAFLRAARSGNVEKVKEFLQADIKPDMSNANGLNAMHLAAKEGNREVVQLLIENGLSVDIATRKGNTSLHIASLAGKLEVVSLLLESKANINVKSQNGFTPLYMAAQENHLDVVKVLLEYGANQAITTDDGFTPLAVALQQGNDKVVQILLDNDSRSKVRLPALHIAAKKDDVNAASLLIGSSDDNVDHQSASGFTPLHIAAHYNNVNVAKLLIEKNADVNFPAKNNITPLHVAAKWGKEEMLKLLISQKANVNSVTRDGLSPIHCAARSGFENIILILLENGADIQHKSKNGLTALQMATQGDQAEVCKTLINKGIDVDAVTMDYLTALHVAAHCGNINAAEVLLKNNCNVNARALNGFTPLHIACKKIQSKMVELLIKYKAHINSTTETGLTPLHIAAFMGSKEIVNILLKNGASISQTTMKCENALHLAARNNQEETFKILLLHPEANFNARARENQTPLHIAVRMGNYSIVEQLLNAGADPNMVTKDNYTALHIAAKEGRHEISRLLLEHQCKPDAKTKKGFTPLHIASKYGRVQVARQLLLSAKVNPNSLGHHGLTPLHVATYYNHYEMIELLLDTEANVNCLYKNGYTPLHLVAKKNMIEVTKLLIDRGANVNAQSQKGFTPLHLNSMAGNKEIMELLLDANADVNHQAENGLTALHLAAEKNRTDIVEQLLKTEADISTKTQMGYTALHTAVHFGQIQTVKMLLEKNFDVNAQTNLGCTSLHLAAQQGHIAIVRLLLDNEIDVNHQNKQGLTALEVAQKQHYLNIAETLSKVTTVPEMMSGSEEKKLILDQPEKMIDHSMSDSEEEGSSLNLNSGSSRSSLNLSIKDISRNNSLRKPNRPVSIGAFNGDLGYRHSANLYAITPTPNNDWEMELDSVQLIQRPVRAGFLISFIVDAKGGVMQAHRHPDIRIYVPQNSVDGPTRIICHLQRKELYPTLPLLEDSEALACRIIHLNASTQSLDGPILLEIPHSAALRQGEREVVVLKSDNGASWKEHTNLFTDIAVQDALGNLAENIQTTEYQTRNRIQRIITTSLPQYFSLISRLKQDMAFIGAEGGTVNSSVCTQVQAVFPEGALKKKIKISLQIHNIQRNLIQKYFGNGVAISPIVTLEPRRRKFHEAITLTLPLPNWSDANRSIPYTVQTSSLRLLCSISGQNTPTVWEDITGTSPLTIKDGCVSFTTTISARVWLIDCNRTNEIVQIASTLYEESCIVPFIGQFLVFCRRKNEEECQIRCLCITDDTAEKTLEFQENFELISSGPLVEVLENHTYWLESSGNIIPITNSDEQLSLKITPFQENRLSFYARIKDLSNPPCGKVAFMEDPRIPSICSELNGTVGSPLTQLLPQKPICTLDITLPTKPTQKGLNNIDEEFSNDLIFNPDDKKERMCRTIVKSELNIREVALKVGGDWKKLTINLGMGQEEITRIDLQSGTEEDKAYVALLLWITTTKDIQKSNLGNQLELSLRDIGREDIVKTCIHDISIVDESERKFAETIINGGDPSQKSSSLSSHELTNSIESDAMEEEIAESKIKHEEFKSITEEEERQLKQEKLLDLIDYLDSILPDPEAELEKMNPNQDCYLGDEIQEESIQIENISENQAGKTAKSKYHSTVPGNFDLEELEEEIKPQKKMGLRSESYQIEQVSEPAEEEKVIEEQADVSVEAPIEPVIDTEEKIEPESAKVEEEEVEKVEEAPEQVSEPAEEEKVIEEQADVSVEAPIEPVIDTEEKIEPESAKVEEEEVEKVEEAPASIKQVSEPAEEEKVIEEQADVSVEAPIEPVIDTEEKIEPESAKVEEEEVEKVEEAPDLMEEEVEFAQSTALLAAEFLDDDDLNDDFEKTYEAALSIDNISSNGKCTATLAEISDSMTSPSSNEDVRSSRSIFDAKVPPTSLGLSFGDNSKSVPDVMHSPKFFQNLMSREAKEAILVKLDSPIDVVDRHLCITDISGSTTEALTRDDSSISSSVMDHSQGASSRISYSPTVEGEEMNPESLSTPINEHKSLLNDTEIELLHVGDCTEYDKEEDHSKLADLLGKQTPEPLSTQTSGIFLAENTSSSKYSDERMDSGLPVYDDDKTNADISFASEATLRVDSLCSDDENNTDTENVDDSKIKIEDDAEDKELTKFTDHLLDFDEDQTLSPIIECAENTDSSSEKLGKSSSEQISSTSEENLRFPKDEVVLSAIPRSRIPLRVAYEVPREEEEYGEESSHDSFSTVVLAGFSNVYEDQGAFEMSSMGSSLHSDIPYDQRSYIHNYELKSISRDSGSFESIMMQQKPISTDAVFRDSDLSLKSEPLPVKSLESFGSLPRSSPVKKLTKKSQGRSIDLETDSSSIPSSLKEFEMIENETKSLKGSMSIEILQKDKQEILDSYTSSLAEFELLEEATKYSDDNLRKSVMMSYKSDQCITNIGVSSVMSSSDSSSSSLSEFERLEQSFLESELKEEAGKIVKALEEGVLPMLEDDKLSLLSKQRDEKQKEIQNEQQDFRQSMRESMSKIQQLLTTQFSSTDLPLQMDEQQEQLYLASVSEMDNDSLDEGSRPGSILRVGELQMMESQNSSEMSESQSSKIEMFSEWEVIEREDRKISESVISGSEENEDSVIINTTGEMPTSMSMDSTLSWSHFQSENTSASQVEYSMDSQDPDQSFVEYSEALSDIPQEPDEYSELDQIKEEIVELSPTTHGSPECILDTDGNIVVLDDPSLAKE